MFTYLCKLQGMQLYSNTNIHDDSQWTNKVLKTFLLIYCPSNDDLQHIHYAMQLHPCIRNHPELLIFNVYPFSLLYEHWKVWPCYILLFWPNIGLRWRYVQGDIYYILRRLSEAPIYLLHLDIEYGDCDNKVV